MLTALVVDDEPEGRWRLTDLLTLGDVPAAQREPVSYTHLTLPSVPCSTETTRWVMS